jgi:hypothetical protein
MALVLIQTKQEGKQVHRPLLAIAGLAAAREIGWVESATGSRRRHDVVECVAPTLPWGSSAADVARIEPQDGMHHLPLRAARFESCQVALRPAVVAALRRIPATAGRCRLGQACHQVASWCRVRPRLALTRSPGPLRLLNGTPVGLSPQSVEIHEGWFGHARVPPVVALGRCVCPAAVRRLIVAVVVDAVERHPVRPLAHVS